MRNTLLTARAYILLPENRPFVRCKKDARLVEAANRAVVLAYANQLLNDGWDIAARDELLSAARVYAKEMDRLNARKFLNTWNLPHG